MVSVTPRPIFTPGEDPLSIVEGAVWAPGPIWTGAESLAPTGIRFLDRPARSQSLYRLRHPVHFLIYGNNMYFGRVWEDNVTARGLSFFQLSVLGRQINK